MCVCVLNCRSGKKWKIWKIKKCLVLLEEIYQSEVRVQCSHNENSMVLAQKQTHISMENNRICRLEVIHLQPLF